MQNESTANAKKKKKKNVHPKQKKKPIQKKPQLTDSAETKKGMGTILCRLNLTNT